MAGATEAESAREGLMAYETWEGSAELTGYGAAVHGTYPIGGVRVDDVTGERVHFQIFEPKEMPGPLNSTLYKQEIKLQVTADPPRVHNLAMEVTLEQADKIAFVANRRVEVSLGLLQSTSPQSEHPEGRSMIFMRRFKGPQDLTPVDARHLAHIAAQIDDVENDRGRRITRALRWLRRADLADDEIEEFAVIMMAYDGLKRLLPQPSTGNKQGGRGRGTKAASKPGINATLRYWAVSRCGIAAADWKQIWDLRNALFHGDLTENADTRSKLSIAIPSLRLALSLALKDLLKLPENAPPYLEHTPFIVASDVQIMAPPFTPAPSSGPQAADEETTDRFES